MQPEYFHTLTADLAFQHCANAAAAAYRQAPAYISYHVLTHVTLPAWHKQRDIDREVMVRTRDDVAVIQDLPHGRTQVGQGFPISPAFDALAYFTLQWHADRHMAVMTRISNVQPLTYDLSQQSKADVVVMGLRYYKAEYAPDSSDAPQGRTHILLRPFAFVTQAAPRNSMYFHELYIDNATGLPAGVGFLGSDGLRLVMDYAMNDGHWIITHTFYEQTIYGPLRIGMVHVVADAAYDGFSFPAAPPDPRLGPAPVPSPLQAQVPSPIPLTTAR